MIQSIADTLNGWATALAALAARIRAFSAPAPDLTPITDAIAAVTSAIADLSAAVSEKDGQ